MNDSEKPYFPHLWQNRIPHDSALTISIKRGERETEIVKKFIKCEFNVPYGYKKREIFDIIGIDLPQDSPILIFIHGGYWYVKEITHSNHAYTAKSIHRHGIKVITIGYEQCPEVTVQEIMVEIELALKRCFSYALRNNSRGVYLMGHSVGAQLISALFSDFINTLSSEEQNLIKAVYLVCGLYDATYLPNSSLNEILKLSEEDAKSVSPQFMELTVPTSIKFYIITVENESPLFIAQSKEFYKKLQESSIESTFIQYEGQDHFSVVENLTEESYELTQLLIKTIC